MPAVTLGLKLDARYNRVLSTDVQRRARALAQTVASAQRGAISVANSVSLANIDARRPSAPPRKGRDDESISKVLHWGRTSRAGNDDGVGLNLTELNQRSAHWIIQEIGSGERAVQRVADRANPVGRPAQGASYIKTVKSQEGRRIKASLAWGTGPTGQWVRPGAGTNQQLYLRKQLKFPAGEGWIREPTGRTVRSQPGIIIRREIEPRHFVQKGGQEGFRLYRGSVLTAARSNFRRGPRS